MRITNEMNELISIEQHLTCGHVIATFIKRGVVRTMTMVTNYFEAAELHELEECFNISDLEFEERSHLNFYFRPDPEGTSKFIEFKMLDL